MEAQGVPGALFDELANVAGVAGEGLHQREEQQFGAAVLPFAIDGLIFHMLWLHIDEANLCGVSPGVLARSARSTDITYCGDVERSWACLIYLNVY